MKALVLQRRNQTKETEEKEQFDRKERKKHKVEITDIRNLRSLRGSVPNSSSARFAILDPPSSILGLCFGCGSAALGSSRCSAFLGIASGLVAFYSFRKKSF